MTAARAAVPAAIRADPAAGVPERRAALRASAADLPPRLACRITPGNDVRIVDLSAAGMLVESTSPLFPGRIVTVQLWREPRRLLVSGTVVRACMAAVDRDRGAMFVSAIAFERRIDLVRELSE